MSLELPQNFENDIQGKDTALVPLVVISPEGGAELLISTNIDIGASVPAIPILLNVPSLKETKVIVLFPEIADVVLEEQEPP